MTMTDSSNNKATTTDETILEIEEMEEVVAPKLASNHNETLIKQ